MVLGRSVKARAKVHQLVAKAHDDEFVAFWLLRLVEFEPFKMKFCLFVVVFFQKKIDFVSL